MVCILLLETVHCQSSTADALLKRMRWPQSAVAIHPNPSQSTAGRFSICHAEPYEVFTGRVSAQFQMVGGTGIEPVAFRVKWWFGPYASTICEPSNQLQQAPGIT
jgi:hypothetical protein